jgi:hypothetical protein
MNSTIQLFRPKSKLTEEQRLERNRKAREWRKKNVEICRQRGRECEKRRRGKYPEQLSIKRKEWNEKNPDYNSRNMKEWHAKHPEYAKEYASSHKEKRRESRWRFQGVDMSEWNHDSFLKMFTSQDGKCLGCSIDIAKNKNELDKNKRLACVDHDHKTGKVRGLLCDKCNKAVGLLGDNPKTLCRLVDYLESHNRSAKNGSSIV